MSWALGKTLLLGVGIDEYQDGSKLLGCLHDLAGIEKTFKTLGGEAVSTVSLKNQDATREKILKSLYQAVQSDAETIIFYYAGKSTRNMLLPVETNCSEPYLSGILVETLKGILSGADQKKVIVILDCDMLWSHQYRTR